MAENREQEGEANVDVPVVDLARIVAGVVQRVVPGMVDQIVRDTVKVEVDEQLDARIDGIVGVVDTVAELVERGAFDDVHDRIVGLYARHLARVAIESGVGVGEYAKMARDAKKGEG